MIKNTKQSRISKVSVKNIKPTEPSIPRMMTIREIARTGLLSEYALRQMLKQEKLPAIYSGKKALINYDLLCNMLNNLKPAA